MIVAIDPASPGKEFTARTIVILDANRNPIGIIQSVPHGTAVTLAGDEGFDEQLREFDQPPVKVRSIGPRNRSGPLTR